MEDGLETALRRAIDADSIGLAFQPKLEFATGRIVGVEALARWSDGERGPQDPSVFIPLAEERGLIGAITDAGIRAALRQWLSWREQGIVLNIAYNISPTLLGDLDFPDRLQRMCVEAGVPAEHLTLELTEGIRMAIDDFGTGYSSLLQLRQLPFNELKIDRWFVTDSTRSPDSALIIHSIIDLAHGLGMSVTAEGVSSDEEFDLLARYGCDQAQGKLIAMAMEGDALAPWLLENGPRWRERVGA
jgi:EAL domain-containing protein (putative c-di-GMP-specific phosphodiesterase class I)